MAKKPDCTELQATIAQIALNYARRPGVNNLDDVTKRVQGHFMALERKDIADSIVAYTGTQAKRTLSNVARKLSDIKTEARVDAALRDRINDLKSQMDTGEFVRSARKSPKATTQAIRDLRAARDKLTKEAELRRRIKEIDDKLAADDLSTKTRTPKPIPNELKGLVERRDALQKQLDARRAEASRAESIRERIAELNRKIKAGDISTSRAGRTIPDALKPLIQERNSLQKRLDAMRHNERAQQRLRQRIAELQQQIASGERPAPTTKPSRQVTPEQARLREQRAELQRELDLHRQIDDMTDQLHSGDIVREQKRQAISNERIDRLARERDKLRRQINERIAAMQPRSKFETLIAEPFNLVRAVMTSIDLSAVGRQGAFIGFGNPVRAAKNVGPMLRAFASESASMKSQREIDDRANAPLYERAGLYLTPVETVPNLSKLEEAYMSRLARKIPGVKHSERAYVTFLNRLRADSFDAMVASLGRDGQVTEQEAQAIANYINVATGRGSLGGFERAAVALNTAFFSPRLMTSRFQLLAGQPIYGGTSRTRKLIAKEYGKFLLGFGVALGLLSFGADEIELDPRSSDFLKVRFGNTRLDIGASLLQPIVLVSRLASGSIKSTTSDRVTAIRGSERPFRGATSFDIITRFLRNKLSPMLGTAVDVIEGENVVGEPVTVKSQAGRLLIPLSVRDIYESMREEGVPKGSALGVLALFGGGLQTYKPKGKSGRPNKLDRLENLNIEERLNRRLERLQSR